MKAKIRGIYSTALTKLLLDNGFQITEPSAQLKERLELDENETPLDIIIQDRYDRHGIRTSGSREATDKLKEILHFNLDDAIVRKWPISVDGIYKGLLRGIDIPTRSILIDIGPAVGRVPEEEKDKITSKEVLVQVQRRRIGAKEPSLTVKIAVTGTYAVLIPEIKIGVSLKITDPEKRAKLHKLGKELLPPKWGIIWRTAAATQSIERLEKEVEDLARGAEDVFKKAAKTEAPAMLREGSYAMDVELPALSKKSFDEIRATTCPTLAGHHYYKVCSGRISSALEIAEKLLEEGKSRKEIEDSFKREIATEYPFAGADIGIEHVKASGFVLYLGKASIEALDEARIRLRRVFAKEGVYDALGVRKEAGDFAVTEARLGEWYFQTKYYSEKGDFKGSYVNFNTPIELYPHAVRYVDLEVDICLLPDGTMKVVDEEKLERAVAKGFISGRLTGLIQQKMQQVTNRLANRKDL